MMRLANLDIDLLRSFLAVARTRSFSRAGAELHRTQSTISLQIKRLEDSLGYRLLDRTPRSVTLTPRGEAFSAAAQRMVALNDEIVARINEPDLAGTVRLGTPEDFATSHLPDVLARFAEVHPRVNLEVTCDLTLNLLDGFREGAFDMVLVKREQGRRMDGTRVWREPLVWVGNGPALAARETLPLVVSPTPCVYRKRATEALATAGRAWRIAYTCGSLAGSIAAVRAGLGITVLPKEMVPPGLSRLDGVGLPDLPDTEIALLTAATLAAPAARLRDHITRSLEQAGG